MVLPLLCGLEVALISVAKRSELSEGRGLVTVACSLFLGRGFPSVSDIAVPRFFHAQGTLHFGQGHTVILSLCVAQLPGWTLCCAVLIWANRHNRACVAQVHRRPARRRRGN